ncbi:MAG: 1,4-alpha-glucan branching protein GlgB [Corynebacterium glucuronolyticum]|nr:1,4-alpha-glucan branching protein GlgB [Mycobacteriaceae bacterium]MDY5834535.1 1,4-alpha-glucan branching protein GlgB [Corynebacterium glucuronolyticum]
MQSLAIPQTDLDLLRRCQHYCPHDHYGFHATDDGAIVRTRQVGAEGVFLLIDGDSVPMESLGDDIWAIHLDDGTPRDYRFSVKYPLVDAVEKADPYFFLPTLGDQDIYLIGEGRHERLWEVLGSHVHTYETELGEVTGTSFAVWAPAAKGVAVVGDFCSWNPSQYPMRAMGSSGVWEIFIPGLTEGTVYKYAIHTESGQRLEKADPMARLAETPPATGSVVTSSSYEWQDDEWISARAETFPTTEPMSVYEVHLGSWKQGLSYQQLADELVDYVDGMGYTHVEFLPVSEHPFGGSWGYQVTGYYAPTSRFGSPDDLRALIDAFHARGIGVILDWVPAHFPKDEWALARFDGSPLYEHPDWRRGEQKDWGTYVFNFGRNEVRNFLVANALYWVDEFHIDGLRVDAVASMLYLDYSREDGEWTPNQYGGRENLEAVQFLQEMNATVHKNHPGIVTIAEESTSWPGVTDFTSNGGLGFTFKWNMGWMHDTLEYFSHDPIHRSYHHNEVTFAMVYHYSERFVLPISHDEVVHGKGTLWQKMPGDAWNKAAGLRTLLAFMWGHPGKQLLFQGQDFGQVGEWNEAESLYWADMDGWEGEYHRGIQKLTHDLNSVYTESPALYSLDFKPEGFRWIKADDADNNILAFVRTGDDGSKVLCVYNFGGYSQPNYTVGVPEPGTWKRILNTDEDVYEGAGNFLEFEAHTEDRPWDGCDQSISVHIPAMSAQFYAWQEF